MPVTTVTGAFFLLTNTLRAWEHLAGHGPQAVTGHFLKAQNTLRAWEHLAGHGPQSRDRTFFERHRTHCVHGSTWPVTAHKP